MKIVNFIFFAGLVFCFLILLYSVDPGGVQITWFGFIFRSSVVFSLFCVSGLLFCYKLLSFILSWLFKLPSRWFSFFARTHTPEDELLRLARLSIAANLWKDARSYLLLLLKKAPSPQIYQLLAILELEENNDAKSAMVWLEKSMIYEEGKA